MKLNNISICFLLLLVFSCSPTDTIREYFDNGNLKAEYAIKNGVKNGYSKTYFENGLLFYEGEYENGKRLGWHTMYFHNGKTRQKLLCEIDSTGREKVVRQQDFNEQGEQISEISFAHKKIEYVELSSRPLHIGDTLSLIVRILNPQYKEVEAMMGHFDQNLNITKKIEEPVYLVGRNHQVWFKIIMTEAGHVPIKGLIRDYDTRPITDSTVFVVGEDSFFMFETFVHPKR